MSRRTLSAADAGPAPLPWWRVGTVWLVVGGPAAVVAAGIATTVIAYSGADPVLAGASRAQSRVVPVNAARAAQAAVLRAEPPPVPPAAAGNLPTTPALQARNHAATPRAVPERR